MSKDKSSTLKEKMKDTKESEEQALEATKVIAEKEQNNKEQEIKDQQSKE